MTSVLLSPHGVFPDVCGSPWGLTVAFKVGKDGPLTVQARSLDGVLLTVEDIATGMSDSTFARLTAVVNGDTWLAYRAFRDGLEQAVVREVFHAGVGSEHILGPTFGNNPVCLSPDGLVAWQDQSGAVQGMRLSDGETLILRLETRPTGLSHLDGDHPVFVDDNRLSEPEMLNPVRAGALTVGEGPVTGLLARIGSTFGQVLGGECFVPRCADIGTGQFAAVTWGPGVGATLVLFTEADIQAPPAPVPVPVEPIPAVNRDLYFGAYDRGHDGTFPSNCRIRWSATEPAVLETLNGKDVAYYVAGDPDGDPAAIERACVAGKAMSPTLPVLAYVPHGVAFPPSADLIGLEAYQKTWETLQQFEQARRQRAADAGRPVILIGQCYSSNAHNTKDLGPLVPVFGRFLRDVQNCRGFVAFSAGSWRATGYEDHPEVHALYHELASTIRLPAAPAPVPVPVPQPPAPQPVPVPPTPEPEPEPIPEPPAPSPEPAPLPPSPSQPGPVIPPQPPAPTPPDPSGPTVPTVPAPPVPSPPPTDQPTPAPVPPHVPVLPVSVPPFPLATSYEVSAMTETVHLIGPGGLYARVDPGDKKLRFDRDAPGPDEAFELSQPDGHFFKIRAIAADVIINAAPRWDCAGTDLNRQFETRPSEAWFDHEHWTIVRLPDGKILAYVAHEHPRKFTSAPLTVEKAA